MDYYYVALLFVLIAVPGAIFFAGWWNERHGLDEEGNPIERPSQHGKSGTSG
ncbi:hypothetical protein [Candidatus Spongiihabitans sp.]|uniref:hypothetical protein n=1 Tax=Candidatus Spongiihabitans sp. TaxID=3101308 RepID=UPI003C7EC9D1